MSCYRDFPELFGVLRDSPGFSGFLRYSPVFCGVLRGSPGFSRDLRGSPRFSGVLRCSPGFSGVLRGSPVLFIIICRRHPSIVVIFATTAGRGSKCARTPGAESEPPSRRDRNLHLEDEFRSSNLQDRGSRLSGPRGPSSPRLHPARRPGACGAREGSGGRF